MRRPTAEGGQSPLTRRFLSAFPNAALIPPLDRGRSSSSRNLGKNSFNSPETFGYSSPSSHQGLHNGAQADEPGIPFVVRRHHIPWSLPGRSMAYHLLIRFLGTSPIRVREYPLQKTSIFARSIQPCQKALSLFLWGKVEEYFHNARPVGEQVAFQVSLMDLNLSSQASWHASGLTLGPETPDARAR